MKYETQKLVNIHKEHGYILVGCDFDDTVFPFTNNKYIEDRCKVVRDLLRSIKNDIVLCLYTVADEQSMKYKNHIMRQWDLEPAYINESKISPWKGSQKPFFNIMLDDKAGLNEAIEILTEFKDYLNK